MNTKHLLAIFPAATFIVCGLLMTASHVQADDAEAAKTQAVPVGKLTLNVPADWKKTPTRSRFRAAQFAIPPTADSDEAAELVIYYFGKTGGGDIPSNIKRWVGQFQTNGRKSKVTKGKSSQGEYVVVDVSGTYNKPVGPPILRKSEPIPNARMLAVILSVPGEGNYFLKLTGPNATVTAVASAFRHSFGGNVDKEEADDET